MIRTNAAYALILLMTATVLCADATASPAVATTETFEQLEHQFNDAVLHQDRAVLDRLLADDFIADGNLALTKTELIAKIMAVVPPKTQMIDSMSVKLYGDTAVVRGVATSEWLSPAGAGTKSFRWVNVWVHGDGGWQVVYAQTTLLAGPDC